MEAKIDLTCAANATSKFISNPFRDEQKDRTEVTKEIKPQSTQTGQATTPSSIQQPKEQKPETKAGDQPAPTEPELPKQTDNSKCWHCHKKMGIYGYQCKCGFMYCKVHRIPEEHECTFDFASVGLKLLEKNNPLLVGKKLGEL